MIKKLLTIIVMITLLSLIAGCDLFTKKTTEGNQVTTTEPNSTSTEETTTTTNQNNQAKNIAINNGILTWDATTNADNYGILIDNTEYKTTNNTYNLNTLILKDGNYSVKVKAYKGSNAETYTTQVTFNVQKDASVRALYSEVIKIFDENYKPDMTRADFNNDTDYELYLNLSKVTYAYSATFIHMGIGNEKAISFLTELKTIAQSENMDMIGLKSEFSGLLNMGISTSDFAVLATNIGKVGVEIAIIDIEETITINEQEAQEILQTINTKKATPDYQTIKDKLDIYAEDDELKVILEYFEKDDNDYYFIKGETISVIKNIIRDGYYDYYGFESEEFQDYINTLATVLLRAYNSDDLDYLNNLLYNNEFDILFKIKELKDDYNWELNSIARDNMLIENFKNARALFGTDRQILTDGVIVAFDYIKAIDAGFDNDLMMDIIELIQSGATTENEIIILKDEIVSVFLDAVPSIDDFEKVYILSSLMSTAFTGNTVSIDRDLTHANAKMSHYSSKLIFEFIKAIDVETYKDLVEILDELYVEVCEPIYDEEYDDDYDYKDEYDMCYTEINIPKVVEFILYVDEFYNEFKEDQKDKFNEIAGIYTENVKAKLYDMIKDTIISTLDEAGLPEDEKAQVITYINDIFDNIEVYEEAINVLLDLGIDVYDVFIDTEGKLVLDFVEFGELINLNEDDLVSIQPVFTKIINDLKDYNNVIFADATKEDLTKVLKAMLHISKLSLYEYNLDIELDIEQLNDDIEEFAPVLADTLYTFVQLEVSFVNKVIENGISLNDFEYPELYISDSILRDLIKTMDEVLTTSVQAEITLKVGNLFNKFSEIEVVRDILGADIDDITEIKTDALAEIADLYIEIHEIASYDFDNLTDEQITNYINFLRKLGIN